MILYFQSLLNEEGMINPMNGTFYSWFHFEWFQKGLKYHQNMKIKKLTRKSRNTEMKG